MTTEINIDYYEELKRKADAWDTLIKLTHKPAEVNLTMTDKGADIMRPYLTKLKVGEV